MFKKEITFFLLIVLLLSGCATSGPTKPIKAKKSSYLYEDTETLVMLDSRLRKQLYLVDESVSRSKDGRLIAKAKFFNKTKDTLKVQIQTLFKSTDGSIIDETNWELILVPGNGYYYHEAKSLNNKADRYTMRCRFAR